MKYKVTLTRTDALTVEINTETPEEAEAGALYKLWMGDLKFEYVPNLENVESKSEPLYTHVSTEYADIAEWLSDDFYGTIENREFEYTFYLYGKNFGDEDCEIDGEVDYGWAATFHLTGFADPRSAFDTAAAFFFSEFFPASDTDLDRRGENIFWRAWTPDDSESWHIFPR